MKTINRSMSVSQMALGTSKAEDLMTTNPMSIRQSATVSEVAAFLVGKGISAAPVIDEAGRPIGVVSAADILVHMGQGTANRVGPPERLGKPEWSTLFGEDSSIETAPATVRDVMTPGVFSVRPETPAVTVVEQMLGLKVRRLFVLDEDSVLIGVISANDVLEQIPSHRSYPKTDTRWH